MGTCFTCNCATRETNLSATPVGRVVMPVGGDCPSPALYPEYGFDTNALDYTFTQNGMQYTLIYTIPNSNFPRDRIIATFVNNNGILDLTSITASTSTLRISTGVSSGQFFFQVRSTISPRESALQFCSRIATEAVGFILTVCVAIVSPGSVNLPFPENLPIIIGRALGTNDEEQICSLTYTVITDGDLPCSTRKEKDYRFYCDDLDIASVMKGEGCTLAEKVTYWQSQRVVIDVQSFVQYAVLRTILAQQLKVDPFGCFNIQFLRQRYYRRFLEALAESEFAHYLAFFELFDVEHYYTLFKK